MAATAVAYVRARSATVVLYAGRQRLTVRMWKRDLARLLRRGDVTAVRRHPRGLTLRMSPDAMWAAVRAAARDVVTAVGALVRLLRAEREYGRFLKMWDIEDRERWDGVPVVIRPRAASYAGMYRSLIDTIEISAYCVVSRDHAVEVLLHELGHRAVRLRAGGGDAARLHERIAPPRPGPAWEWWSNKEELVCELGVAIALGRGRIERGAMRGLARRIAGMSGEEAAQLWRHTRWGAGPRVVGVTRHGLVLG